jgi:hypothetical protein
MANGRNGEWANGRSLLGQTLRKVRLKSGADTQNLIGTPTARRDFRPTTPHRRVAPSPFRPFAGLVSLPFVRISRLIDPVCGINDVFGGTTQLDESVGQKCFAIDPDPRFVGVKHN